MGKPHNEVYNRFMEKYRRLNQKYDKEQYLVPYLISSHPGSTLNDAIALAEYLNKTGRQPEQVQDFYPTPGTLSTCMYYTEIDPRDMTPVYVPKTFHEKAMQRALLQWRRPEKRRLVIEALKTAGREDLIGYGKNCLVRPDSGRPRSTEKSGKSGKAQSNKPVSKPAKQGRPGAKSQNKRTAGAQTNKTRQGGKPQAGNPRNGKPQSGKSQTGKNQRRKGR
jgi:hypothetical protein